MYADLIVSAFSWSRLITGIYALTIVVTVLVVILDNHNPTKALLWVFVLVLLPVGGMVFYIFFGRNLRRRHLYKHKPQIDVSEVAPELASVVCAMRQPATLEPILQENLHVARLLVNNDGSPIFQGNQVSIYHSGRRAFEALLADLKGAKKFIHMEFYIFSSDRIGHAVAEVLIERAQAGVEVVLIYDDVGSFMLPKKFVRWLEKGGVTVKPFQRVFFPWLSSKVNYRNHRKIVIVDGQVAHMGGMNIADKYVHGDKQLGPWHDTQLRIVGPATLPLHHIVLKDYDFVNRDEPPIADSYPCVLPPAQAQDVKMQVAASGPDSDWASIMQAFFVAIAKAQRYVYITTPYFIPNESILTALRTAALSGVDVKLLLPGKSDSAAVSKATKSYIGTLLEAGVQVYLFKNGFNHSKVILVDGALATVGSANMDIRSFENNFEVCSFIYDHEVTRRLEEEFIHNAMQSHRVSPIEWAQRQWPERLAQAICRLFSPLF